MSIADLTAEELLRSIWAALRRIEDNQSLPPAPLELPTPQVFVEPPDLGEIVTAVTGLKPGPTADEIAAAIASVLTPSDPQPDGSAALREVAAALEKLDFRLKGTGVQAYGGGSVALQPNQTIGIAGPVQPAAQISTANSVSGITLAAGATWLGTYEDITNWSLITYAHNGAPASATGTVQFEFSFDQSQIDVTAGALQNTGVGLSAPHTLIPVAKYVRLRYVNGSTPLTDFRFQTVLHSAKSAKLTRFPIQTLTDYDDVDNVRSIVAGKNRFGQYANVDLSDRNAFQVEDNRLEVGTFGELATSSRIEEVAVSFDQDVLSTVVDTVTSGGATAAVTNSQLHLDSGTATTATARVTSRESVRYRPGHEIAAMFTAVWPTASVTGGVARIGLFDDNDGFWIGYSGGVFGSAVRRGGVDSFTARTSWNEDLLAGDTTSDFQRGGVAEAISLTTVNVFRINFGWLGSAPAAYEVLSPDGHWVVFHRVRQPNTSVDVHILNPNLPIRAEVTKSSAGATNIQMRSGSWSGSVRGVGYTSLVLKSNTTTTNLGSNATYTGAWENCEHHVSIACNVSADVNSASNGWRIQFSDNASTVRREELHSYNGAGSGRTIVSPAVSKFFRIIYTNGGVAQTSFSLQTKLSVTQLQSPEVSISDSVDDTAQTSLVRAVLVGKAASDGNYYNVPVSQTTGNLKTDIAECTAELNIKSLTAFQANQAIVAGTAVQVASSAITNRRTITFKADPANTKVLYLGQNSAVSTGNGFPLAAGDSIDLEVDGTPSFWCISQTSASQVLAWAEVGK